MSRIPLLDLLPERLHDSELLTEALTHRSAGTPNNERLEYLGDAVLGMVMAEHLFKAHPEASEGDLSRLRATLVNKDSLAVIGKAQGLGGQINLGQGELKSGGARRNSILADAVEAVIGAVYLDSGFDAARCFVLALYADRLDSLPALDALKDPKTRLQEWLQGRSRELPVYEVTSVTGKAHEQRFRALCRVGDSEYPGEGTSRRRAEQAAAEAALKALETRNKKQAAS
jgi:ribonuclease-3